MNILIMGPAGSGKGTMSEKILENYNIPHISTGDMLREAIKNETKLGLEAQTYMNEGKLVPDDLVIGLIAERLQQEDCQKGYLIDGFPRSLPQAKALEEITNKINKPIQMVINLTVDFDALAERVTGRRICKNCGAIYHIKSNPPKVEGICDVCGSPLAQRADDTVEQLRVRLNEHYKNTQPCLDYYKEKGLVVDINASQPIEMVYNDINCALAK
ncbi:adenylate kinase [Anaerorhabdus furcosa]|uniref:Adenylate kinase n=1 Tax=Anaerorhabdus furcosa TaxID=118967 RepID=A0A1T4QHU2_9FIRM|nr:adenylate kinase [Anaerorhabdus furcosa]SKA03061.1 Adenylate kinase [Anaerorhabdus furcosa]